MDNELFNPKTVERLTSKTKITAKQKRATSEWLELLKGGLLEKEKQFILINAKMKKLK